MLVGRARELTLLAERMDGPLSVVVLGEAGVGKTALIRAAVEQSGRRVYEAGALATLSWLPYLPLKRAFGRDFADGDTAYVAGEVEQAVGAEILFFDDLQWADAQTSALVPLLAGRVSLVSSIRRGEPGTHAALETAASAGLELLPLEPLGASDAAELARRLHPGLSSASTERLVRLSGGNPLLLEQLAATGEPSESLRRALEARVRMLSPAGRESLGLLALLGRPDGADLVGAGGAELVAAGLASANGEFALRHALIAEAAADALDPDEQRRLHSRLADALSDPGESARHHAAAGERDVAHRKALVAAQRASTPGERAAHLGVAAANAEGAEGEALRVEAARLLVGVGEYAEALALVESMPPIAAEAALLRSQAHAGLLQFDDAVRELAAAVDAGTEDPRLSTGIAAHRAYLALRDARYAEALALAEQGVATATASGVEGPELVAIYSRLAAARMFTDAPNVLEARQLALDAARRTGTGELEVEVLGNLVFGLLLEGKPADADAVARDAVERARALRLLARERRFRGWRAGLAWHLGDPTAAAAEGEAVLAEAMTPVDRELVEPYFWFAMTDLGQGESVRPAVEARVASAPPDDDGVGDTLWALADLELAAGRADAAERAAAAYLDRFGRAAAFVGVTHAWSRFEQGALPTPLENARWRLLEAAPVEVDAIIALFNGDALDAGATFDRAARLWDGRHIRGAVRCRWAAAESLRRADQLEEATARLLLVESDAEQRGLDVLLRKIRRSLRLAGVHRAAPRTADGVLTGREREVLELVAEGLNNDAIAHRLGLARPTVVRLIRTASAKLGATSRAQAAVLAKR